ncbi:MAG: hypothetical protein CL868_05845 [Cytophagaceae bacterium]|nr:hypothetical protein [Cytophagaceae bacterium]
MVHRSMNIQLDKSSNKFHCPGCGKKRFVRYVNIDTGEYLHSNFGRCDREINCGYFQPPKSGKYHQNLNSLVAIRNLTSKASFIPLKAVNNILDTGLRSNLSTFFSSVLGSTCALQLVKEYNIGLSNHWSNSTIFWQIDQENNVRSGKILLYNPSTGKRIKKPYNHINWYHKTEKIAEFNLQQCLFGLHLIKMHPRKPIAIVESEKTACIMSTIMKEYNWLATGALSNIKTELFVPIYEKNITMFPDASMPNSKGITCYSLWTEKANKLRHQGFQIRVSNLLEIKANEAQKKQGFDIADFFIPQLKNHKFSIAQDNIPKQKIKYQTTNEKILNKMRTINPEIETLIQTFDLNID